jgi:hypothetical protein
MSDHLPRSGKPEDDCSCGGGDISGHDSLCPYALPLPPSAAVAGEAVAWQPIETAPKGNALQPLWVIGFTTWGKPDGPTHSWVGPCEWVTDHFEFSNTDFDVFPRPTHWHPWPASPLQSPSATNGLVKGEREAQELRASLTLLYEFCCGLNDFRPDSPLGRKCRAALASPVSRSERGAP